MDVECRDYHDIRGNYSTICSFVNSTDDCQMDEGFIDYMVVAFCYAPEHLQSAMFVLYGLWLVFLFVALGTTAESFFCPCLEYIAHNLKLSHNIAGVTVVAFGNGAPDIFSAIAAFTNSNPGTAGVAIGSLLGAGVFVTTVVAGCVAMTKTFNIAERPFLRDVSFYIATVFWTFCLLYFGSITLLNAIVVLGRYINKRQRRQFAVNVNEESTIPPIAPDERQPLLSDDRLQAPTDGLEHVEDDSNTPNDDWTNQNLHLHLHKKHIMDDVAVVTNQTRAELLKLYFASNMLLLWDGLNPIDEKWNEMVCWEKVLEIVKSPVQLFGNLVIPVPNTDEDVMYGWNRPLNSLHCVLTPLFCVFATKGGQVTIGGSFPLWSFCLILGVIFACIVWYFSKPDLAPKFHWVFAYIGFVGSVICTYIVANEIVNLLRTFGAIINVTNVIMGLTFLAWGNSIGDTIADVTLSKQGYPRMAISACFGGPLFNLLVGLGLPCTISIIKNGHPILIKFTTLEAVLSGGLLFSLIFSLVYLFLMKFKVGKIYGVCLFVIYIVFLPLAILTGIEVI